MSAFYVTTKEGKRLYVKAFDKAKGRIRSLMSKQLSWRVAPELRFLLDESVDNAERIESALKRDADRNK